MSRSITLLALLAIVVVVILAAFSLFTVDPTEQAPGEAFDEPPGREGSAGRGGMNGDAGGDSATVDQDLRDESAHPMADDDRVRSLRFDFGADTLDDVAEF